MNIRLATDADRLSWNQYVAGLSGIPELQYEWKYVLHQSYGVETHFFIAEENNEICGVCPVYVITDWKRRKYLYSIKFGLQGTNNSIRERLLVAVHEFCGQHDIRGDFIAAGTIPIQNLYKESIRKTIILNIPATREEAWAGLRNKTRNMIRKSERAGLSLEYNGREYLQEFYDIYAARMLEKGIPIHSYEFFKSMASHFKNSLDLILAKKDSRIIAGILMLRGKDYALYPYQVYRTGFDQYAPTQFLIWEAMKVCINSGISILDMGESKEGSNVYQSKINFGGEPRDVYYYTTMRTPSISFPPLLSRVFPCLPYPLKLRAGVWMKKQGRLI